MEGWRERGDGDASNFFPAALKFYNLGNLGFQFREYLVGYHVFLPILVRPIRSPPRNGPVAWAIVYFQ